MNDLNDQWIDGIKNIMVELYNKSRETYFVNFMFKATNLSVPRLFDMMQGAVTGLYESVRTRFSRQPQRDREQLPIFVGMPDLPVPKNQRKVVACNVNGGFHFNGMMFVPHQTRALNGEAEAIFQRALVSQKRLERLHFTPVTHDPERVAEYTIKLAKKRPDMKDKLLFLPE